MTQKVDARLIVGILSAVVAVAFEAMAVATAMPKAAEDLGGLNYYAWAFTLFVIGQSVAIVLAGRMADRLGPVRPFFGGLGVFLLGLIVAGAAQSMGMLIAGRFIQGVGAGLINVTLMVVVAQAVPEHRRASVFTAFSVAWVAPAFIGPPVAAFLTERLSWHWVFWTVIPLLLLAVVTATAPLLRLHAKRVAHADEDLSPVPIWAAILTAAAVAGLQIGGQRLGWTGAAFALVSLVLLLICLPRLMPQGFFRVSSGIAAVAWTRGLQAGAFFATEAFLPLSLVTTRNLTLFQAGLALTIGSIGWTTGSWLQSRPWVKLRRDQLITLGTGFVALCVLLMAGYAWLRLPLWVAVLGWTIGGLGMGISMASETLAVMNLSPEAELGRNTSSLQVAESLGQSISTGLAGTLFAAFHTSLAGHHTFGMLFAVTSIIGLLSVACSMRVGAVRNATSDTG